MVVLRRRSHRKLKGGTEQREEEEAELPTSANSFIDLQFIGDCKCKFLFYRLFL